MLSSYEIAVALSKTLPNTYQLAPQPDHPYLLIGPGLMVGGDGRLTAIILVTKSVTANALRARITASRLALPAETRIVALLVDESTNVVMGLDRHFDALLSVSDWERSLTRYVQSDARPRIKPKDLKYVKQLHAARYSAVAQITTLRRKQQESGTSPEGLIVELQSRYSTTPNLSLDQLKRGQEVVMHGSRIRALHAGRSMMASLRQASESKLRTAYTLDDGVPYSPLEVPPSLLLIDSWPYLKSDPEKPFRAAAFSGWIMASSDDTQDVEKLIERANEFVRGKVYERTQG